MIVYILLGIFTLLLIIGQVKGAEITIGPIIGFMVGFLYSHQEFDDGTYKLNKMSKNKITKEELEQLQAKISVLNNLQYKLGALAVDQNKVLKAFDTVREELRTMQMELKETYGNVSINVEDGSLTETEETDEQADKKD